MSGLCATVSFLSGVGLMWLVLLGTVPSDVRSAASVLVFFALAALIALTRAGQAQREES